MAATYRTSAAGGGTSSTGNRSCSITPAVGDLFVVFCNASGNTNASPTCSDDNGGTYTLVGTALKNSSADILSVFVRDQLLANTTSTTVTVATGSNTAGEIVVVAIAGMTAVGSAAIRSQGFQANQAAATTPAPTLNQSALTSNPTITAVANGTAAGSVAVPNASWTERQDASQSTPTTGLEVATRDSGFTGATITYGGTSASAFASVAIELDSATYVTAALTGQSLGDDLGTLVPGTDLPLSGQTSSVARGSVSPDLSIPLTGQSLSVAQGSVSYSAPPSHNIISAIISRGYGSWGAVTDLVRRGYQAASTGVTAALTGQSVSVSQGSLTPSTDKALTGQAVTAAQGTPAPSTDKALSGQAATVAQGTIIPATSLALTSQSASVSIGSLASSSTVPLSGQFVVVGQGSVTAGNDVTAQLTGQSLTVARGSVTPSTDKALTGQSLTVARGTLVPALSTAISGQFVIVGQGSVSAGSDKTAALTGQSLTVARGSVAPSTDKSLSGQSVSVSQGTLVPAFALTLTGQALGAAGGLLTPSAARALTGQSLVVAHGTLVPALVLSVSGQALLVSDGTLVSSGGDPSNINTALLAKFPLRFVVSPSRTGFLNGLSIFTLAPSRTSASTNPSRTSTKEIR